MIKLYYSPGTACLAPHFLLEELGLAYELILVDTSKQEHQQAAYLALNPNGKIPLLIDGDFALTESAAICLYLMDQYASTSASPLLQASVGSLERARLYQWMLYLSNTLQAELLTYFYPERLHDDAEVAAQIKEKAAQRIGQMLSYIDQSLSNSDGDYLLGKQLSIADFFLFMLCRWTRGMQVPARNYPQLGQYLAKLIACPAILNAFKQEGLEIPFY